MGKLIKLRELREERRLNQEALALRINVSQSTISAYEVGERTPDVDMLTAIARFFNVSIDYLLGLTEVKEPIIESDLSMEEIEFLHVYRNLKRNEREKVISYIDGLCDRRHFFS